MFTPTSVFLNLLVYNNNSNNKTYICKVAYGRSFRGAELGARIEQTDRQTNRKNRQDL